MILSKEVKFFMITSCPFCKPNVEDIKFYESENFLAIYNVAPILPGHSLVIPRRHVKSMMELSDPELCELMIFSRRTVKLLLEVFGVRAFNWTIQDGDEAGQTIPHFHLHLIPRKQGDLPHPGDWYPKLKERNAEIIDSDSRPKLSNDEMSQIVEKIRQTVIDLNI